MINKYNSEYLKYVDRYIERLEREVKGLKMKNGEIEIIEDKPKTMNDIRESYGLSRIEDKKIEKLELTTTDGGENTIYMLLANKIDEIIDYLNKGGK